MKSRTFARELSLGRLRKRIAIVCAVLVAAACVGDTVTSPNPTSPPPVPPPPPPPPPAPSIEFGTLVVAVSTSGTELDPDGYVLKITAVDYDQSRQVNRTDSVRVDPIRAGAIAVEISEVAANCWVVSGRRRADSITSSQTTAIHVAVTCEPMSGVLTNAASFVGVWEARSWEFFGDRELTSSYEDVIAGGMAGTLTVSNDGGSTIQWHWRETYRWWGPNRPTLIWGHARVGVDDYGFARADALSARADSGSSEFECDWGDCEGPLHGDYRFVLTPTRLVITRVQPIPYYTAFATRRDAWLRLVLERVQ